LSIVITDKWNSQEWTILDYGFGCSTKRISSHNPQWLLISLKVRLSDIMCLLTEVSCRIFFTKTTLKLIPSFQEIRQDGQSVKSGLRETLLGKYPDFLWVNLKGLERERERRERN
jgi:hypothetical protein